MSQVELVDIAKRFGHREVARGVTLEVLPGEVMALLGPSGSGKSTLLRLIAGLETADRGTISIGGNTVSGPSTHFPPEKRRVGFVFQSFALFPHLDVWGNVSYACKDRAKVAELIALVGLTSRERANVQTLSGGEQQRVALARALASQPQVLLLDEPFANLDAELRRRLRDEVALTLRQVGITAILVTHDASEAFALAHKVAVLHDGIIIQIDTPEAIYHSPNGPAAALTTGEVMIISARATAPHQAHCALGHIALQKPMPTGAHLQLALRPEMLALCPPSHTEGTPAQVLRRVFEGTTTRLELKLPCETLVRMRTTQPVAERAGEQIHIRVTAPASCWLA